MKLIPDITFYLNPEWLILVCNDQELISPVRSGTGKNKIMLATLRSLTGPWYQFLINHQLGWGQKLTWEGPDTTLE